MIKKALIHFKDFELKVRGQVRQLSFSSGFKDPEYHSWRISDEDESLHLTTKDGEVDKLYYDPLTGVFKGNHKNGGVVELSPVVNFIEDFKKFVLNKRQVEASAEKEIVPKRLFAVLSNASYPSLDVYKVKHKVRMSLDKLFSAGYDTVVYSDSASEDVILKLYDARVDDTVVYAYNGNKKNQAFCITKKFWDSVGNTVSHLNIFAFLEQYLETERIQEKYLEEN